MGWLRRMLWSVSPTFRRKVAEYVSPELSTDLKLAQIQMDYWEVKGRMYLKDEPFCRSLSELKTLLPVGLAVREVYPGILELYAAAQKGEVK